MRLRQTARLRPGAVLAPIEDDAFAVYPDGDRRRRPAFALAGETVEDLVAEGVLEPLPGGAFRRKSVATAVPEPETSSAIRRLAALAGPAGPAWFGGRAVATAERLWRDGDMGPLPEPLRQVLEVFRGDEASLARLERAQRWPPGAGRVALKLALELVGERCS